MNSFHYTHYLTLFLLLQVLSPSVEGVQAQNLIDPLAARRIEKRFSSNDHRIQRAVQREATYSVADSLRVETAEELLASRERESEIYSQYKAVAYLSYVRSVIDADDLLYDEEDAAQKVLLLEGLRLSNQRILQPLLGDFYDRVIAELRYVRDKTSFSLVQSKSGELDFSPEVEEEKALVQFRIHGSARNGVEPRLRFGENVELRLQPLERQLLLEYTRSF